MRHVALVFVVVTKHFNVTEIKINNKNQYLLCYLPKERNKSPLFKNHLIFKDFHLQVLSVCSILVYRFESQ